MWAAFITRNCSSSKNISSLPAFYTLKVVINRKTQESLFMATKINIQQPAYGLTKNGYYGYSWTYLFFGWFVPLFRGELSVAALHLLFSLFTFGIWQIIVSFLYNNQYMTRMIEKGYVLIGDADEISKAKLALGLL